MRNLYKIKISFIFLLFLCQLLLAGGCGVGLIISDLLTSHVENGVDVLRENNFSELAGKNIGLITNSAATTLDGSQQTWKVFAAQKNLRLVALFAPEHGINVRETESFNDTLEPYSKIKVYSLFGENRTPTNEMLQGIDTLVFDIPSIGVRYYTYEATMAMAMEVAAKNKITFVVLDRVNPINGVDIAGPITDTELLNFNSYFPVPIRHGMTLGELAVMYKEQKQLNLDLKIIKIKNWSRSDFFTDTGLSWVPTSPNIRTPEQALLYSGLVILENANISVGRGTKHPFEQIGAPWINGEQLLQKLESKNIPGIKIELSSFTPSPTLVGKVPYSGEICSGIKFQITDQKKFDPLRLGIFIATALRDIYPEKFNAKVVGDTFFNKSSKDAYLNGLSAEKIIILWSSAVEDFRKFRGSYLLY